MVPSRSLGALAAALLCASCSRGSAPPSPEGAEARAAQDAEGVVDARVDARADAGLSPDAGAATDARAHERQACPQDMVHVATSFCPDVERRCLDMEHEEKNNLPICHAFAQPTRCRGAERPVDFCIDRYEYPNQKGAHPVWMLDAYQAQATCESKGKRLCMATEWTAACEGPEHTPFPYGWERDHDSCNMDNFYIDPRKPGPKAQFFFYSKDPAVAFKELSRLDESVPSGSMESCKSGFGVYDMPGNVDEWTVNDGPPHEKSQWAALKGGAWGHVRSQCRPTTYSHEPEFYYYFVGLRCCQDAEGAPPEARVRPSADAIAAPPVEPHDFAPDPIVPIDAPGPTRTKFSRTGHRE